MSEPGAARLLSHGCDLLSHECDLGAAVLLQHNVILRSMKNRTAWA